MLDYQSGILRQSIAIAGTAAPAAYIKYEYPQLSRSLASSQTRTHSNMPATKKTIAIVGATGTQGISVARTFLASQVWHVRCLTRSPTASKAQGLTAQGAEIVQADLKDIETLHRAFSGAHAIFLNTDFWGPYRSALASGHDATTARQIAYNTEVSHGRNAIFAASQVATLERFVYSALGPMSAASGGKYPDTWHWETKAHLVDHLTSSDLRDKTSLIYIGCYLDNQFLYPKLHKETVEFVLTLPCRKETRLPVVDTERSTGPFVEALVEIEEPGTKLLAYDEYLSFEEVMRIWSRVTGKQATFVQKSVQEMHEETGMPLEVLETPAFLDEYDFCAGISNIVEPCDLRRAVGRKTVEEAFREMDLADLLGAETWS